MSRFPCLPRRISCILALAATAAVGPATAQNGHGGRVELGSYGAFTKYDAQSLDLDSRLGAGGRLGVFLIPALSIEANGDFTQTATAGGGVQVDVARIGGTLFGHLNLASWNSLYLGAGYERLFYRGALAADDNGGHVILGDRLHFGPRVALRLEGRAAYFPSSVMRVGDDKVLNIGGAAGISIFAFGGRQRDSDGDLVRDKRDQCPDTPAGAVVDDVGCPTDSDRDSVFDGLDSCPHTPVGAVVDALGCPKDTDADRVLDGIDICPDTPPGAEVDQNGCPLDTDADGVFDGLDQCPATPEQAEVDTVGCPKDSDQDGVFDGIDRCAATPAGTEVDSVGCPVLFREERGRVQPLILKGVNFAVGKATLTPQSHAVLDEVAKSLLAHPEVRIEVSGHTDATGSRALNMRLSLARAQSVATYLASKGVAHSRLDAQGYGPDRPIATNSTAGGRRENRRVELHRIDGVR